MYAFWENNNSAHKKQVFICSLSLDYMYIYIYKLLFKHILIVVLEYETYIYICESLFKNILVVALELYIYIHISV